MRRPWPEDAEAVRRLYDVAMADNVVVHDLVYPHVFGPGEYVGQFSDNSATELRAMGEAMALPRGARVLDAGCGNGAVAAYFRETFDWNVSGIDLSIVSTAAARRRGVDAICADLYTHDFGDARFDGIYATGAFCHFDAERLFGRVAELLRPRGVVAFMERIRRREPSEAQWMRLTAEWSCPSVYDVAEYETACAAAGLRVRLVRDLTESFRRWQRESVEVRIRLRDEIVRASSARYHETSLALAKNENDATAAGILGYILFVAAAP